MDGVRTGEGGVRELQGDGLGSIGVDGRSRTLFTAAAQGPYGRLRELGMRVMAREYAAGNSRGPG